METVCTGGITSEGQWIRLHPVSFRYLDSDQQYRKYQWICVDVTKHERDTRAESFRPNEDTIHVLGPPLGTGNRWEDRKKVVLPLEKASLEAIKDSKETLGLFRPAKIESIKATADLLPWSRRHMALFEQQRLFGPQQKPLEKMPWRFRIRYTCSDRRCTGHDQSILDWEVVQLFRGERKRLGSDDAAKDSTLAKLHEITGRDKDVYLYVGNILKYPKSFIVAGIFYPPKDKHAAAGERTLFSPS